MISPNSALGIFDSCISLTAQVSPVAQFKAPNYTVSSASSFDRMVSERTVDLPERALAQAVPKLLEQIMT